MPVEEPGKISQWMHAFRMWLPSARQRSAEWYETVREEPALVWHTPAVRYGLYAIGALVLVLIVQWGIGFLSAGGPEVQPPAKTASFHVLCSTPNCRYHFVINRKFGFDSFPVECPKCHQETGQRAYQCFSKTCNGRWTYGTQVNKQTICARCREPLPAPGK
jgi:hypothetical protein